MAHIVAHVRKPGTARPDKSCTFHRLKIRKMRRVRFFAKSVYDRVFYDSAVCDERFNRAFGYAAAVGEIGDRTE